MTWRAISIDKSIYNTPLEVSQELKKRGMVNITLSLPPIDIPHYVYFHHDKRKDIISINFDYSNEETPVELISDKDIDIFIGKRSGKLLQIVIKKIHTENIDRIVLKKIIKENIRSQISDKISGFRKKRQQFNLSRGRDFLTNNAEILSKELADII